jgi:hypothetical protein
MVVATVMKVTPVSGKVFESQTITETGGGV